jgi:hypothetical protein
MQTFLPYPSFEKSASVLDYRRLGKQRVEAYQILRALRGLSKGWVNHPATVMWRGYEPALEQYLRVMINEWTGRGYNNTMVVPDHKPMIVIPPWFGDERVHASHRANLKRKDPEYYSAFDEDPAMPYYWPNQENPNG